MYEPFFGLSREPFAVAPDPRFLYMSEKHREALEVLMYGLHRGGGFVLLTGEIGAGKTTIWRCFLERLPSNVDVAYVVNPKLGVDALLARVCEDLRVEQPPAGGAMLDPIDAIHGHLMLAHARGRRTLVVVDEAQALSIDALEQLRLLTNLVIADAKLLQLLLIGQPELNALLDTPALEPVAQRVVARFHLPALAEADTRRYIAHRLAVAGLQGDLPFDDAALAAIHRLCRGVPRRINVLCDRALFAAQAAGSRRVDAARVEQAADEVFVRRRRPAPAPQSPPAAWSWQRRWALVGLVATALVAAAALTLAIVPAAAPAVAAAWQALTAPAGRGAAPAASRVAAGLGRLPAASAASVVPAPAPAASVAASSPAASSPPGSDLAALFVGASVPVRARVPAADATASEPGDAAVAAASAASAAAATAIEDPAEVAAWRRLAALWGEAAGRGDPCGAGAPPGLRCYRVRGGLAPIRQLGRPGIVTLRDERGRVVPALLVGLDDATGEAMLRAGDAQATVPLAQLARVWRGDFGTYWRAPPGYRDGVVGTGTGAGALAAWLDERLAQAAGATAPPAASAAAGARIFAFQLAQGLAPDGLAGPLTLMQLGRLTGVDEPRLAGRPGAAGR